jgi:uncharacterized protein
MSIEDKADALRRLLASEPSLAVAVSGGVDSMTLATFAHRSFGQRIEMFHATSPAVPPEGTGRVEAYADREGWTLHVFDAGEFRDADYLRNPVNRCFYCKTNLYSAISRRTPARILSGTNTDDLGDYRPGLIAAEDHRVRHPYVECGIDKASVRALARHLGLADVAELPAAPCLASRIETGIGVEADTLQKVHAVETLVAERVLPASVRCRIRAGGVVIELDSDCLGRLTAREANALRGRVSGIFGEADGAKAVTFEPYRAGSAFVGDKR